jgi:hypothetical protein
MVTTDGSTFRTMPGMRLNRPSGLGELCGRSVAGGLAGGDAGGLAGAPVAHPARQAMAVSVASKRTRHMAVAYPA